MIQGIQSERGRCVITPDHDVELMNRLHYGDEIALAELYDRYIAAVLGSARRFLDANQAEEVAQDVFLKLWKQPQLYQVERGSVAAFIMTMVRHQTIDRLRQLRPEDRLFNEAGDDLPLADPSPAAHERSEWQMLAEQLRKVLCKLSPAHRETVERAYFAGESREDIAQGMGVPLGTVKSRLKYALDKLRLSLQGVQDAL